MTLTVADVFNFHETGRREELGPGHMPRRSSIVWVLENKGAEIDEFAQRVMIAIMEGKLTADKGLAMVGEKVLSLAKARIKSRIPPPLSEARLKQKQRAGRSGETPLINTGQMINSLRYNVIGSL